MYKLADDNRNPVSMNKQGLASLFVSNTKLIFSVTNVWENKKTYCALEHYSWNYKHASISFLLHHDPIFSIIRLVLKLQMPMITHDLIWRWHIIVNSTALLLWPLWIYDYNPQCLWSISLFLLFAWSCITHKSITWKMITAMCRD